MQLVEQRELRKEEGALRQEVDDGVMSLGAFPCFQGPGVWPTQMSREEELVVESGWDVQLLETAQIQFEVLARSGCWTELFMDGCL